MKRPILFLSAIVLLDVSLIVGVINFLDKPVESLRLHTVDIDHPIANQPDLISAKPLSLTIPKLQLNLTIREGEYNTNNHSWTIDNQSAFYAVITPKPNNLAGNTLIYGHNSKHIFGRLSQLEKDDEVKITAENNKIFVYKLIDTKSVKPTDVSLFEYKGAPILTIQTCSGTRHKQRQLFIFALTRLEN